MTSRDIFLFSAAAGLGLSLMATSASAGAFGIEMGAPISSLKVLKHEAGTDNYEVSVPTPHSEFESYTVRATAQHGVCKIVAIGKDHEGDPSGASVKLAAEQLRAALDAKYGKDKHYDFLKAGALWKEPGEYAMGLRTKERVLTTFWTNTEGSSLPADISTIALDASATGRATTYLVLAYEFGNFERCMAGQQATDNKAL